MSVCQFCNKEFEINIHPKENLLKLNGVGPVIILLALLSENDTLFVTGAVLMSVSVVMTLYLELRYFRKWPRFKKRGDTSL